MNNIHIYVPQPIKKWIEVGICPDCGKRTRFLVFIFEWLGAEQTCIKCGRTWQDGEWCRLNFSRTARKDSIEAAKRMWRKYNVRKD